MKITVFKRVSSYFDAIGPSDERFSISGTDFTMICSTENGSTFQHHRDIFKSSHIHVENHALFVALRV